MGTLRSNAKGMQEMIPSAIPLIFFQVAFYVFLVQATIIVIYDIKSLSSYLIRLFFFYWTQEIQRFIYHIQLEYSSRVM